MGNKRDGSWAILHISDTQFGQYHRFGMGVESLAARLLEDVSANLGRQVHKVDAIVVSGDVTERALPAEFEQATIFVRELSSALDVALDSVVLVPGNHDVSWKACEAYCCYAESKGEAPQPPYDWKWENYLAFQIALTGDEELYAVKELPAAGLAIARVNSTVHESHLKHYGHCGELQLRQLAATMRVRANYFRVAVLHHNVRRKAEADDENLRDEDDFTRILGPELDLVLHGHTHDGKQDRLSDGTLVLSTGSAAVAREYRPGEVPNQYQVLIGAHESLTRFARRYEPDQKRFTPDNRVGGEDSPGLEVIPVAVGSARDGRDGARASALPRTDPDGGGLARRRLGIY